ncbi:insulin-like growth factor-binding protein complex acid labile subunit [Hetaerina americana]|uniref:insulin-like growth factor-binding protein complex acid labile subunit n=1 Tax=Hetaerina americana TaxID=62018 RepID=UPI003A7F344F
MRKDKLLRGIPTFIGLLLLIALLSSPISAEYPPLECPKECSCHYFRINWVVDCSMRSLSSIPSGLSESTYILDLSRNKINGKSDSLNFPPGSKFRRIHLAENKLTEVTGETFAGLTHLLEVDLSGNAIEKFSRNAFLNSPGLISLELRRNPLTGPERGKSFITSRSLKNIDLSDCRLRRLSVGFFDEATAVSEVDLSGNPLESIDAEAFKPLTGLEKLLINRCLLTSISPDLLKGSQHLKLFEAAWNPKLFASEKEPKLAELLTGLNRLDHLDLRGTGLRNIPSDSFKDTAMLGSLMLADNDISASSSSLPDTLSTLANIHLLDLSGCHLQLSSLSFLSKMSNIRVLKLGRNDLSKTQTTPAVADSSEMDMDWSISHLNKLKRLALDHCEIQRLPSSKSFSALENVLAELDVSDNPLLRRPVSHDMGSGELSESISNEEDEKRLSESIRALRALQNLDMSRCNISHLPNDTFAKSSQIRRLSLSGNMLTVMKENVIIPGLENKLLASMYKLEVLELSDCGFPELPSPDTMPQATRDEDYTAEIDKKKKRIDDDEDAILDTADDEPGPYLRELNFAGNPIKISGPFPPYISSLTKMDLSRCGLAHVPGGTFWMGHNLTDLSLAGNPLGSSGRTIEKFSKPRSKDVLGHKENSVHSEGPGDRLSNNSSLVEIIHVDDKPTPLDLSFLSDLPSIRSLDLRRCNLTSLSIAFISKVNLKSLRLAGNPWVCDCQLVNLWDWASSSDSDILLHRSPPVPTGSTVVAAASIEEENGLRCTARDGTRIPWSRYVLSSHQHHECGPLPAKLVALASRLHQEPADVAMAPLTPDGEAKTSGAWSTTALACSLGALILLAVIAGVWFVRSRMSSAPRGNALLLDEEELGNVGTVRWASKPYRETTQR